MVLKRFNCTWDNEKSGPRIVSGKALEFIFTCGENILCSERDHGAIPAQNLKCMFHVRLGTGYFSKTLQFIHWNSFFGMPFLANSIHLAESCIN